MKVVDYREVPEAAVAMEGAAGCRVRCLIGPDDAAPSFSMRRFEVEPGGHTPRHRHAYEHEVFVLQGEGVVVEADTALGDRQHPIRPGTVVFVPPNRTHQFRNTGSGVLAFLCLIPHPMRGAQDACAVACGCE
mgnify:CR=1 FL=1